MTRRSKPLIGSGQSSNYNAPFQGMINFSVNALGRVSHAGIDHFVFGASVLVGNIISWSQAGMNRFYSALRTAPVNAGYHNVLWFGFGYKNPLQILTATDSGCRFAALSACLAEVYSVNMAGSIMLEFSRRAIGQGQANESQQTTPPSFPLWAEQYMAFDREVLVGQHAWPHGVNRIRRTRGVAKASDVANALFSIMGLRTGATRHLAIIGTADAALVAAIGVWLLDLKVILFTSERQQDDDVWFRNFTEQEEPHLTVIYSRQPGGSDLVQRDRTIQIPDATALLRSHSELRPSHDYVLSGRVVWKDALSRTFGDDMRRLLTNEQLSFGSAVGSAAHIFSALEKADQDFPSKWLRAGTFYFFASQGTDFLYFAEGKFPEQADADLQNIMLRAAKIKEYMDACAAFQESLKNLAVVCICKTCCPDKASSHCFVATTVTVIRIIRGLSGILVTDNLYPCRKGLEYIYRLQQMRVARVMGSMGQGGSAVDIIVEHGTRDLIHTEPSPLRFAEYLFRKSTFPDEPEEPGAPAIGKDGICVYLDILHNPLSEDPTALCRVNVIPGHIQFEGRLYNQVGGKTADLSNEVALENRPSNCVPEKVFTILQRCAGGNVTLNVTDSTTPDRRAMLGISLEVSQNTEYRNIVHPWRVVQNISRGLGLIHCRRDGCTDLERIKDELSKDVHDNLVYSTKIGDSKVSLFSHDPVTRLLVTQNCWEPLIQRDECLACTVRPGCEQEWKEFAVFCRLPSVYSRLPRA
ncbi:hypothetical protein BDV09DRAFT_187144 [Aspergillus tetrazonus]